MENPIYFLIRFLNFHSPSRKQGNKTSCFCLLLLAMREVSSPFDQLLLFFFTSHPVQGKWGGAYVAQMGTQHMGHASGIEEGE